MINAFYIGWKLNSGEVVLLLAWAVLVLRLSALVWQMTYGMRTAHQLNKQASHIRWIMVSAGVLLIWISQRYGRGLYFEMHPFLSLLIVLAGGSLILVFLLMPDSAYYLARGMNNICGIQNPPDPIKNLGGTDQRS